MARTDGIQRGVSAFMRDVEAALERNIGLQLAYLGTEAVNRTRDRGADESWCDQTGNLRSSVGMAVYEGRQVAQKAGFATVGHGAEGSATGEQLVEQLAGSMAASQSLAIVAGMEYASHVEARDDKDVLAGTEVWVRNEVEGRIRDAVNDTIALANRMKISVS